MSERMKQAVQELIANHKNVSSRQIANRIEIVMVFMVITINKQQTIPKLAHSAVSGDAPVGHCS